MSYPRLCKNCGKPFTGKNLYHVFCTADCGKEYYQNLKKLKPEKKIAKIEMEIKEEGYMYEENTTNCCICGKIMDYGTYDYACKHGRICKECIKKGLGNFGNS